MGNGRKARFEKLSNAGDIRRPGAPEPKPAMRAAADEADQKRDELPDNFVVVLTYNRTEDDTSEEFAEMVESFKALFSLRDGMRVYGLFDKSAKDVLAIVEKPVSE